MKFSPTIYSRLRSRLKVRYQAKLTRILKTLKKYKALEIAEWVDDQKEVLKEYSSVNWYFIQQLELLAFFLTHPLEESDNPDRLSKTEDQIFDKWNQSEFADIFLKQLNRGESIAAANEHALHVFEQHLLTLGNRHVLKEDRVTSFYRPQLSLGERKVGGKVKRLMEASIHIHSKSLSLRNSTIKEMKDHSHRIETALNIIRKASHTSWERFEAFTETIIPIKIKEFVSYSHQELPGVSMINLYDRDFIDLMDDLIHENGHHHLNHYLNIGKLIDEPLETIYYSPWRRTLRPLRGIYHAYFTFFWAYKLFFDLSQHDLETVKGHVFTEAEKEKILWRVVEEYWMLEYSYKDLLWAKRKGLINADGWKLIQDQKLELNKGKKKIALLEKKLHRYKKDLQNLKKELKSAEKKFKKH